jgi:hypothetical protein
MRKAFISPASPASPTLPATQKSIHKSFDGTKVVNYAQWLSREDFEAMTKNPEAIPHMKACAALAKFDPILCEVVDSLSVRE